MVMVVADFFSFSQTHVFFFSSFGLFFHLFSSSCLISSQPVAGSDGLVSDGERCGVDCELWARVLGMELRFMVMGVCRFVMG